MSIYPMGRAAALAIWAGAAACPAASPTAASTWRWDTAAQFDECYRDRYADSATEPGSVQLVHAIVVADEMGKGYNDFQPVRGKTQARKILVLDDADVSAATLLVGGRVQGCDIVVNGTVLGAAPLERTYWNADFDRYVVPPRLLKAGANEFVFRARDAKSSGSIRIENSLQPDRSAVSRDGGYSWDSNHLAEGGYCDGEFQVRLNLVRYAPAAWLQSPVLDLATLQQPAGLPAAADARVEELTIDAQRPSGTTVSAFLRTGATPDGYEENWSRWYAWPSESASITWDRFVQWRVELTTRSAQKTPVIRSVSLRAAAAPAQNRSGLKSVRIAEDANQRIVRSSYEFAYGDYDGNARILRANWDLAGVVAPGTNEVEKLRLLRHWVREQWNGWDMGSLKYVPPWDARLILTLAPARKALGMCTHYATTYVQCSQALGYTARSIFRGHALSESWSDQYRKWIVMDAGMDNNHRRRATYHFERNGVLLNELEVRRAYFIEKKWDDIRIVASNMSEGTDKVEDPLGKDPESVFKGMQQIFLPLRNNFVDHREPEEPEHGQGYFKFLGHIFWKDAATAEVPWTDFFTTREADLYWTLNQAQIYLRQPAEGSSAAPVLLDTVTPNFAGYEYRIDGGEWTAWIPDRKLAALAAGRPQARDVVVYPMKPTGGCIGFAWPLHPGRNSLEARPINKAGHRGIESRLVLDVE